MLNAFLPEALERDEKKKKHKLMLINKKISDLQDFHMAVNAHFLAFLLQGHYLLSMTSASHFAVNLCHS